MPANESSPHTDDLIVQDTSDDSSFDEDVLATFQLPTPMFTPLYRTDSILKRKHVDTAQPGQSGLTAHSSSADSSPSLNDDFTLTDVQTPSSALPLIERYSSSTLRPARTPTDLPPISTTPIPTPNPTKRVKFASHVQVQHTVTQYQRSGIPPPYHLNFWRRNRVMHVVGICSSASIVLVQAIILGVFWNQTCTKPIQFIYLGDVLATGVISICIITYASTRFVLHQIEQHRRKSLKQKTLRQLKQLKKKRQREFGFVTTPRTPSMKGGLLQNHYQDGASVGTPTSAGNGTAIDSRASSMHSTHHMLGGHHDQESNSSTVEEHQIHIHTTSFHKSRSGSAGTHFSGNLLDGVVQVESEDDLSDMGSSRVSSPMHELGHNHKTSSPLLISSLRTKVTEASIHDSSDEDDNGSDGSYVEVEEDGEEVEEYDFIVPPNNSKEKGDNEAADNSPNGATHNGIPHDSSSHNNSHDNNSPHLPTSPSDIANGNGDSSHTFKSTSGRGATPSSLDSPSSANQPPTSASVSTLPPMKTKFRNGHVRRSLKTRKFRDSIVLNKKQLKQMKQDVEPESHISTNVTVPVIVQVQISENPKQDYRILSRSIQEVEQGTLMLEPLADHESAKPNTKSIQALLQYFVRRKLFGLVFFLTWSLAHLWAIVSLVFIIDYGNCPTKSSVLYFLNAIFFVCTVVLAAGEFCVLVLSFR